MLYPVFMFKTDSGYDGYFPDVEGCFFAGDSL
ncbi:HicB family protein, partial [Salmonella enterica]|nr:HicB family protein [Salmonella enterica]